MSEEAWVKSVIKMMYMNEKGMVFVIEAIIAMLLFALMLMALPQPKSESTKEIIALQQANDLLRVWSAGSYSETEIASDLNEMFAGNAELWAGEKRIVETQKKTGASEVIATEGILLNDSLQEVKVKIVVYFD